MSMKSGQMVNPKNFWIAYFSYDPHNCVKVLLYVFLALFHQSDSKGRRNKKVSDGFGDA